MSYRHTEIDAHHNIRTRPHFVSNVKIVRKIDTDDKVMIRREPD